MNTNEKRVPADAAVAVLLLFAVLLQEIAYRGFGNFSSWLASEPYAVLLNVSAFVALYGMLVSLTRSRFYTLFVLLSFAAFVTACNYLKLKFLSENIYPWDLLSLRQGFSLTRHLQSEKELLLYAAFMACLIAVAFACRGFGIWKQPFPTSRRLLYGIVSAGLLLILYFNDAPPCKKLLGFVHVQNSMWDYRESYTRNGFVLSSFLKLRSSIVLPPDQYDQAGSRKILAQLAKTSLPLPAPKQLAEPPTVIVILSESLWDPLVMKDVAFRHDPMPFLHQLSQRGNGASNLLVPALFGGTCKTEFEALTGFSNAFFHPGSVPFLQYMNKEVPSVAWLLRKHGYKTIGVHPNDGWFWNRNTVYPQLGFEQFITVDAFSDADRKGPFVSDLALAQKVLSIKRKTPGPKFIFVVTMQNHGPYAPDRYGPGRTADFSSPAMSEKTKGALGCYMEGLNDFDGAVKTLVDGLQNDKDPTILLVFGDHLPYLGIDGKAYREARYITSDSPTQWTLSEEMKMRTVPFFAWGNSPNFRPPFSGTISPIYLPYYICDMAGVEPPPFYRFLHQMEQSLPGLTTSLKVARGEQMYKEIPRGYQEQVDQYWFIQYDIMFGNRYTQKDLFN